MHKLLSGFALLILASALAGCGPDNQGSCQAAEDALNAAYEECGYDEDARLDLSCEGYANTTADCTQYFETVAETATCDGGDGGTVTWEYGPACS